jgi:peptide/nickel transport system substrate-binding protein
VIEQSAKPDALDPALAGSATAWKALWLVYTPLLTYRHAEEEEGAELIPGLASDLPEVSDDGLTYELTLREGLEYSDGTEVEVGDFEHSIRRALTLGGAGRRLFGGIAGAREYARGGDFGSDISGIDADVETRDVTITLTQADPAFSKALALPPAGLVPSTTPFRDLSAEPPPGVGPYELTESIPGSFVLERSERFDALDIPDIPTGNLAGVTTRIVPAEGGQAPNVLPAPIEPDSAILHPVFGDDYSSWELKEGE